MVVFTFDYFLRLFTSPAVDDAEYDAAAETAIPAIQITDYLISRLRFMLRPLNIIDLLAILPFVLVFWHRVNGLLNYLKKEI